MGLYFRELNQALPDVQDKMMSAWQLAINVSEFLDKEWTPEPWLDAFQGFATEANSSNVDQLGAVRPGRFYALLSEFLQEQVCVRACR